MRLPTVLRDTTAPLGHRRCSSVLLGPTPPQVQQRALPAPPASTRYQDPQYASLVPTSEQQARMLTPTGQPTSARRALKTKTRGQAQQLEFKLALPVMLACIPFKLELVKMFLRHAMAATATIPTKLNLAHRVIAAMKLELGLHAQQVTSAF